MKSGKNKAKPYLSAEAIQAKIQENPIVKLGDVVYAQIEDAILSSELAPGQKINITKLAETMGVSTTPVRSGGGPALCQRFHRQPAGCGCQIQQLLYL